MKPHRSRATVLKQRFPAVLAQFAKLCIRFDVPLEEVTETFKACMIDAARQSIRDMGDEPNKARVALITRMSRKEVARLWNVPVTATEGKPSALATVLEQWRTGRRWQGPDGCPVDLPVRGPRSFAAICESCNLTGYTVRSFLDQLEQLGSVEALPNGDFRLIGSETVTPAWEDLVVTVMRNLAWHIGTIRHNLENPKNPWLERAVGGAKIRRSRLAHVRQFLTSKGREAANAGLEAVERNEGEAECDTAVLGLFYWERKLEDK